jgi:hypothetical protein
MSACLQDNQVVSKGIRLPLEVFKTANGKGWGLRSSHKIPIGSALCSYIGLVVTDE